jgi:hypothetical protein
MGETIAEDHVYNLAMLPDGSGLLFDGMKGFARGVTPSEIDWYRRSGRLEESFSVGQEDLRDAARHLHDQAETGVDQLSRSQERMVTELLEAFTRVNVEFVSRLPPDQVEGWRLSLDE